MPYDTLMTHHILCLGCDWDGGDCCGDNVKTKYCEKCECLDPAFGTTCKDEDETLCQGFTKYNVVKRCSNPHVASLAEYPKKCKKSCGKCQGNCEDTKPLIKCQGWKEKGYCSKSWMKPKCKKTCGLCWLIMMLFNLQDEYLGVRNRLVLGFWFHFEGLHCF